MKIKKLSLLFLSTTCIASANFFNFFSAAEDRMHNETPRVHTRSHQRMHGIHTRTYTPQRIHAEKPLFELPLDELDRLLAEKERLAHEREESGLKRRPSFMALKQSRMHGEVPTYAKEMQDIQEPGESSEAMRQELESAKSLVKRLNDEANRLMDRIYDQDDRIAQLEAENHTLRTRLIDTLDRVGR